MRKILWPVVGIAGLGVFVSGLLLYRATPAPSSPGLAVATPALRDSAPAFAVAPDASVAAGAAEAAPTQPAGETGAPDDREAAPPEPPPAAPAEAGSDLPVVHVAPRPVHAVPDGEPAPPAPVTLTDRSGRVMTRFMPRAAPPPTGVAATTRPPPASLQPLNAAPPAAGATLINVAGQPVKLFGVRPPDPTDVCLSKDGHAQPCGDVARDAVASRLAGSAGVHCRTPGTQPNNAGEICLDGTGVDVAGFLVGEGLALADVSESSDYVGAEGVARANRRGLWRYR